MTATAQSNRTGGAWGFTGGWNRTEDHSDGVVTISGGESPATLALLARRLGIFAHGQGLRGQCFGDIMAGLLWVSASARRIGRSITLKGEVRDNRIVASATAGERR